MTVIKYPGKNKFLLTSVLGFGVKFIPSSSGKERGLVAVLSKDPGS